LERRLGYLGRVPPAAGVAGLLDSPALLVMAAAWGALWGSFFNVCIARVPRGMSVVAPPSHCFACKAPVRAYDNIPLLSYLWLRGRCRACGVRFSPRYLLIEALSAALSAALWWQFVWSAATDPPAVRLARFFLYFAFAGVLVVLAFIDLDTKRLPDVITLPAVPVLFLAAFGAHDVPWLDRAIGAAAGYLVVRIIADGYYYLTGREGMGLGDGKLLAVVGAVLGWRAIPAVIGLASFVGIVVTVPLLLAARRRVRHAEVPFGPFLAFSALVYLLAAEPAWAWFSDLMTRP
jgi:leader peptidase (prepilin peptidase)/N-methyltransferase